MSKADFDRLKDLRQRNFITEKCYIKRVVDFGKIYLEKNMKLKFFEFVETKSYGGKFVAREDGAAVKLQAKIVITEKCPKQDIDIWPSLKHPNILRLLAMEYISTIDARIFISEYYFCNLETFLQKETIINNQDSPEMIKRLLLDILMGLNYLHDRGYSHLVLKPKNILISRENTAIISNFSSLSPARQLLDSTKISFNYGPPELHFGNNCNANVYGTFYDVWSFGILALNIFTDGYIRNKIPEDASWSEKVYPRLFKILQMRKFSKYIEKAFPASKMNKLSKKLKINFVITCLRIMPSERPSPDMLLKHKYFMSDGGFITVHKAPWHKKCNILTARGFPLGDASAWFRNRLEVTSATR